MNNRFLSRAAFTLTELALVVVMIGIIVGFALPNYQKSIARGEIRQVRNNLIAIQAAQVIHQARTGSYWPTSGTVNGLDSINANLGIDLASSVANVRYGCRALPGGNYLCAGTKTGSWGFNVYYINQGMAEPFCEPLNGTQNPC